mgnify:CR=1 FL=1
MDYEEDNPGDILLDLSNFNIDPGTAKIKTVKINHWKDYDPFEPYISETFYIDEKVLKFTEGTLYDYDSDQLSWIRYTKNNEALFSSEVKAINKFSKYINYFFKTKIK